MVLFNDFFARLGSKFSLKLKPEYGEGSVETLDVLVLGGYYGEGTRRSNGLSHFLLGVVSRETMAAELSMRKYVPFGEIPPRTAYGYSASWGEFSRCCPSFIDSESRKWI